MLPLIMPKMFSRRKLVTFITSICAVVVMAGCSAEPTYHGKKLSQWVMLYGRTPEESTDDLKAEAALRAIGTNALPYLLNGWPTANRTCRWNHPTLSRYW